MNCPACKAPLIVVERAGIELDYCLACKGLWFDAEELNLLAQALKLDVEVPDVATLPLAQTQEAPRRCPRCRKKMDKVLMGEGEKVLLDRCKRGHGLWFDAGELRQVIGRDVTEDKGEGEHLIGFVGRTVSGAHKDGPSEAAAPPTPEERKG